MKLGAEGKAEERRLEYKHQADRGGLLMNVVVSSFYYETGQMYRKGRKQEINPKYPLEGLMLKLKLQ